jgi:hypothetical protein
MSSHYPIVRHRELRPRGRWSAWRERRCPLVARTGRILVHESGGEHGTGTAADPGQVTAVTLVDVRDGVDVTAYWTLWTSGTLSGFPVTVTFRCTVVDPVAVVRAHRTGPRWNVRDVLAQDPRPAELNGSYPKGDEDGLRRALTALLAPRPAHRDIPGVRVELAEVRVERAQLLTSEAP